MSEPTPHKVICYDATRADSACTDIQLREWLRSERERGTCFMQAIAEAAFLADVQGYRLLRPVLIKLQETRGQDVWVSALK